MEMYIYGSSLSQMKMTLAPVLPFFCVATTPIAAMTLRSLCNCSKKAQWCSMRTTCGKQRQSFCLFQSFTALTTLRSECCREIVSTLVQLLNAQFHRFNFPSLPMHTCEKNGHSNNDTSHSALYFYLNFRVLCIAYYCETTDLRGEVAQCCDVKHVTWVLIKTTKVYTEGRRWTRNRL